MEPDRLQEQLDRAEECASDEQRLLWAVENLTDAVRDLTKAVREGFDGMIYSMETKDHPYRGVAPAVSNDPLKLKNNPDLMGQGSMR